MVVRGDLTSREFRAFGLSDSRVLAGMNVTIRDVNDAIQQLVRSGGPVGRGALADRHVPLDQLTTGSRTPFLGLLGDALRYGSAVRRPRHPGAAHHGAWRG